MKLLSIIEATKIQEGSLDSYYAYHDAAKKWAEDTGKHKDKFAYAGTDVQDKYIEPEMKKRGLVPDRYMGAGVTSYKRENVEEKAPSDAIWGIFADDKDVTARYSSSAEAKKAAAELQQKNPNTKYEVKKADPEKIEEGEERSIIRDACIEKLVDEFRGEEHQFENLGDLEYAIYSELERIDVEDCVDPDMEHGGQRMGDFASGGVLNVIDSNSVIDDVIAQLDTSELEEGITTKHSYDPVKPGGQSSPRKPVPLKGQKVSLDGVDFMVTLVSDDRKTFDVVNINDPKEVHRGIKVDSNSFFIENLDYLDKSKYKDMPMKLELQRALAQMLGIDNYYKMDVEELEKQLKSNPANSTLWNEYSAYKKKLQIQRDDKVSPTIGNFASDNRDPRFREGKSPHKKGSAKYKKHMAAMHAEAKDPKTSDADQIIKQIIDGYGIDNLEDVFRQYYPQLSDEQVERFISKHKKPELRLIKNEDVDLNDDMIGTPDEFYDAEERQEAFKDLQDALQGNYMDDYIKDGACPACAGNGYMDGEEEVYNDETEEYEEGTECDGFGNYGCDEGEMTYGSDGPSWVEIIKHDRRKSEREKAKANYPGDEKVINQIRNMVMGMDDPRMAMQQMAIDYPHMGRRQRAELVAKGMKAAGLTDMGENMNENKWKEIETNSDYMLPVTMNNEPLDWPTYWEWEQSHGETNKNKASLRFGNYVADAKHELNMAEGEQHGNSKIYKKCWTGYSKVPGKKAGEKGSCKKNEGRIEDTFGTKTIDKHDKPEKKKSKKDESIQAGDELMIETADGEGIVVPVLHVVDENILVGWDELAEDIVVEGARQLEELRKLAGIEIKESRPGDLQRLYDRITTKLNNSRVSGSDVEYYTQQYAPYFSDALKRYGDVKSIEAKDSGFVDIYVKELLTIAKMLGESIEEAEYQGRKVKLGKPTRGDVKKFKVYVKDPKTGNVKKVNFGHGGSSAKKAGQKTMKIKKSNPARRKSFRARHNCDNPGPRTKARYWSCRAW